MRHLILLALALSLAGCASGPGHDLGPTAKHRTPAKVTHAAAQPPAKPAPIGKAVKPSAKPGTAAEPAPTTTPSTTAPAAQPKKRPLWKRILHIKN
jgi:hypothetical protein